MPTACTSCGAELETPLACAACGSLFEPPTEPTPYEVFGLEPAFAVDRDALRKRLLRFSRLAHPDFHSGRPEEALAEANSALLNRAHELLTDPVRRAGWLVGALGGPSESDERSMPQPFLMEVLEWNETLEEARADPGAADLEPLRAELEAKRSDELDAVEALLTPLPEAGADTLADVRRHLNAIRYLDRALSQITELGLDRAARP